MKKAKFLGLNFGSTETLSIAEKKKVKGGYGYGGSNFADCSATCLDGHKITVSGCSSCSATDAKSPFDGSVTCGTSTTWC